MTSPAIQELVNIVAALPDNVQAQVIEHLREYITDLQDEQQWEIAFQRSQSALVAAAKQAKQQKAAGQATEMDYN